MKYKVTVSIPDKATAGTAGAQYIKIKGTNGETDELQCDGDFTVNDKDVTCTVESSDDIGHYECVLWRTAGTDDWSFTKVIKLLQLLMFIKGGFELFIQYNNI